MADAPMGAFPSVPPGALGVANTNRFSSAFPDPYLDYASTAMPRSIYDVLRWCEYIWCTYGTYRMAAQRVVSYFLTKIELTEASDDEKEKYEDFLENQIKAMSVLATAGNNYMAYGNDFLSMIIPFRRHLRCRRAGCRTEIPMKQLNYSWDNWNFQARCPKCGFEGQFERVDRTSMEADPVKIKHWSPHEMRLLYHPITDKTVYMWEIPSSFKTMIKTGNTFYLENTAWEVIEAIKKNELFRFNDDVIFHLKDETIAGMRNFGWGIPLIMSNFKQAWYLAVLKRYNEAIALDYVTQFRVFHPVPGSSREADPVLHQNLGSFVGHVMNAWKLHRKDPATIHALPFPIEMKAFSGDANKLAPIDLLEKGTDEFLNAQGIPAEFYRGSLQVNVAPVALRLFERTWVHMNLGFNGLINWMFKRFSELKNWENLKGRLQPTSMAYDIEDRQIKLQMAAGQQISKQTAYAPFGINIREEIRRMLEEEEFQQDEQAKFQEKMQQKNELQNTMAQGAQGQIPPVPGMPQAQPQPGGAPPGATGDPAQGGMPPGPLPPSAQTSTAGMTPEDMAAQAEQIAQQMLTMPYEMRKSELLKIKKANETLHSLVIAKMEKTRGEARTQGGFALLQQQTGQGS